MAQISRPFQIALIAVALLAGVWFIALGGHRTSTTGAGSSPATPASAAPAAQAPKAAAPTAPGVAGLAKDVERARGAAGAAQQNAKQVEERSAALSTATSSDTAKVTHSASPAAAAPAGSTSVRSPAKSTTGASTKLHASHAPVTPKSAPAKSAPGGTRARQVLVEHALGEGKVAVILFWDAKGSDDRAVQQEVRRMQAGAPRDFVAFQASSHEVTSFGTITRGVQVYGTPTLLIVNKKGQTTTITGFTDAYSIQQAINEARRS